MARVPEVHFRLRSPNKDGLCAIYLEFLYNRKRLYYSLGQSVKKEDWNYPKERVKKKLSTTIDGQFALNELMDTLAMLCNKSYKELLINGIPEPDMLRSKLELFFNKHYNSSNLEDQRSLLGLFKRFISGEIKNKGNDRKEKTLGNYEATYKHLVLFQTTEQVKLNFNSITLEFFYKYIDFLRNVVQIQHNTIAKDIAVIKSVMGEAVDLGYTENFQFRHKKFSFSEIETDQIYLNEQELSLIYKAILPNQSLDRVRDLFIFGAWVGLRYSDYSDIKPENLIESDGDVFIKVRTKKTNSIAIIPCNPVVMEIFEKYKDNENRLPLTISNQKFNKKIKQVCEIAGLTETGRLPSQPEKRLCDIVSSHTCRRSFATNYYLQGFSVHDLMKITTHTTEKSFLKYIRVSHLDTAKKMNVHNKNKNWAGNLLNISE